MSSQETIIFRSAKILCTTVLEMENATEDLLLDVMHSANFGLNVIRASMRQVRYFRELP